MSQSPCSYIVFLRVSFVSTWKIPSNAEVWLKEISHPVIQSEPMVPWSKQKSATCGADDEAGTRWHWQEKSSLSIQDVSARAAPAWGAIRWPRVGNLLTAKEALWTMLLREISKETELSWALMNRKNWVSAKRHTGIQRRKVEVRSRMAHSRQGTDEKLHVMTIKTSSRGTQREGWRDEWAYLRGLCVSSWAVWILSS